MRIVEKAFRVMALQLVVPLVVLQLRSDADVQALRAHEVIEPVNEDERIAKAMGGAVMKQLMRMPGLGEVMRLPPTLLPLTVEQYEKLGKPTVGDALLLKIEFKKE